MKINRDNYEEFLLLAIDKELEAPALQELQLFLESNPDLKLEAAMLETTILTSDDSIRFHNKQTLHAIPQLDDIQATLLSYLDNELTEDEMELTRSLTQQMPELKTELILLEQTKLSDNVLISYPWKKELYKQERRILPFYYFRIAAAVTLLLGASWLWFQTNPPTSQVMDTKPKAPISVWKEPGEISHTIRKTEDQVKVPATNNQVMVLSHHPMPKSERKPSSPIVGSENRERVLIAASPILETIIADAPSPIIVSPNAPERFAFTPSNNTSATSSVATVSTPVIVSDLEDENTPATQIFITDTNKRNKTRTFIRKIVRYTSRAAEIITASSDQARNIQISSFELGLK